jgi:SAM-dependent methyltransferase
MKKTLLEWIVCPQCQTRLQSEAERVDPGTDEILQATLTCAQCRRHYPVLGGIPVLLVSADYQAQISRSFGFQWRLKRKKLFESKTLYGREPETALADFFERLRLDPGQIRGKRILEAGCGSGMLVRGLSQYECEVVGVDLIHPAEAFEHSRGRPNVHIITADLFQLPFPEKTFDVVWSEGVLHHTPDPSRAFASIQKSLKSGGTGYVWVYSKSPQERLRLLLRTFGLPRWILYGLCYALVLPYAAWTGMRILLRFRSTAFAFFDALSPRYQSGHGREEVRNWFSSADFSRIEMTEDRGAFWQAVWGVGIKR